eukprot:scaffold74493_cov37-Phaeocystis_antarctica.AAC.1
MSSNELDPSMQLKLMICHPWVCSVTSVHFDGGVSGGVGGGGGGNGSSSQHPVQSHGRELSPSRSCCISEHVIVSAHSKQACGVPVVPMLHSVEHWAGRAGGGGEGGGGGGERGGGVEGGALG